MANKAESELEDEIARAQENAAESFAVAPNSYGAGYDTGFVAGMKHAVAVLKGARGE